MHLPSQVQQLSGIANLFTFSATIVRANGFDDDATAQVRVLARCTPHTRTARNTAHNTAHARMNAARHRIRTACAGGAFAGGDTCGEHVAERRAHGPGVLEGWGGGRYHVC